MRPLTLLLLAAVLAAGCGSMPASPSAMINEEAPLAVGLSLSYLSLGESAQGGLGSPLTATAGVVSLGPASPGTLETVTFRVTDVSGAVLAEAGVTTSIPIPAAVAFSPQTASVSQTLTWSTTERGYGKRVEVTLTIRDSSGATQTLSFSSPR